MVKNITKNKKLMFIIGGVIAAIAALLIGMSIFGKESWTENSYNSLKIGTTTEQEVIKRFGKPVRTVTSENGNQKFEMWTNVKMPGKQAVEIWFIKGKVISKINGSVAEIQKNLDMWQDNFDSDGDYSYDEYFDDDDDDDYDDDDYDDDDYEDDDYDDESDDEYDEDDLVDDIGKAIDFFS